MRIANLAHAFSLLVSWVFVGSFILTNQQWILLAYGVVLIALISLYAMTLVVLPEAPPLHIAALHANLPSTWLLYFGLATFFVNSMLLFFHEQFSVLGLYTVSTTLTYGTFHRIRATYKEQHQ